MEWVETTGKTVDEATELALDQLGVAKDEADIEVLEVGKTGLFGRVRVESRIRARVRPATSRSKDERRDRPKRSPKVDDSTAVAAKATKRAAATKSVKATGISPGGPSKDMVDEVVSNTPDERPRRSPKPIRAAGSTIVPGQPVDPEVHRVGSEFLEGLLESFDLEATVTSSVVGEGHTEFKISGNDLGVLIGPKALTLAAIQDLLRTIVHYGIATDSGRILLDIAGYRERRRAALQNFAQQVAAQVIDSGELRTLEPMSPADRKVVHDAINDIPGVRSSSEGEEPNRRVVLLPA